MNFLTIILPIIIVIIVVVTVFLATTRKRTLQRIERFKAKLNSRYGSFINDKDIEALCSEAKAIATYITKRDFSDKQIKDFILFSEEVYEKIINNNIKYIEDIIAVPLEEFNKLVQNHTRFITGNKGQEAVNKLNNSTAEVGVLLNEKYNSDLIALYTDISENHQKYIDDANKIYMEQEKEIHKELFDCIDNYSLDEKQRTAIVNDDDRQLVVAGAGCGKTLTMAAKVKYLCERKGLNPEDILLLSFTNKAANEMQERLERIGIKAESSTFHKYGLDIVRNSQGKQPDVLEKADDVIKAYFEDVIAKDEKSAKLFLSYLGGSFIPNYKEDEAIGDQIRSDRGFDLTTIKSLYVGNKNKESLLKISEEISEYENVLAIIKKLYIKEIPYITDQDVETIRAFFNKVDSTDLQNALERIVLYTRGKFKPEILHGLKNDLDVAKDILVGIVTNKEEERRTLKNEVVKSREEVKIANYLFLNGVEYEYESAYKYETGGLRKQYRPDFYLKNDDVYLEHFGIDEYGRARQYAPVEEQKYLEGIEWKRKTHRFFETKLIETYSYQFRKSKLSKDNIKNYLDAKLDEYNITRKEVSFIEILNQILSTATSRGTVNSIRTLMITFMALFKSNDYKIEKFDELMNRCDEEMSVADKENNLDTYFMWMRRREFLRIEKDFYVYYNEYIKKHNLIDFNDMINSATKYVTEGQFQPNYKYVIVDEYQDISKARYNLISATLEKSGAKLFCVGDDWQSIFKFAGSEIALFTEFGKYFGLNSTNEIVTTYRNSQQLLDIAGNFIMKNDKQIKKQLKSYKSTNSPLEIWFYGQNPDYIVEHANDNIVKGSTFAIAFNRVLEEISKEYGKSSVLILGRNNSDLHMLSEVANMFKQHKGDKLIHKSYPDLSISFMTVHKAKGTEADNVIIINMTDKMAGFPNQIIDDPILELLKEKDEEELEFAEERRLLYVALTRSKNKVYMLAPSIKYSLFIKELEDNALCNSINHEEYIKCPACGDGTLIKRRSASGNEFVGCTNYPRCSYTAKSVDAVKYAPKCPVCGNFLTIRSGKYGSFYGCLNYPYCDYTENL